MNLITIIVPCYNEERTLSKILDKIIQQKKIKKQIILVDDFSSDNSIKVVKNYSKYIDKFIQHKSNKGKGACIKSAQKFVKGNVVIIQDADLEYNPNDYKKLITPIINNKSKVVYGSRVLVKKKKELKKIFNSPYIRILGNYILTQISNLINSQNLTDAHTCYKVFDSKIFKKLKLMENGFAFCPEVTSLISKQKIKIMEVSIDYKGRSVIEGKKIKFRDAIRALYVLVKTNLRA
jgi:glycosyltransferase involved in cell wall biosynthesis